MYTEREADSQCGFRIHRPPQTGKANNLEEIKQSLSPKAHTTIAFKASPPKFQQDRPPLGSIVVLIRRGKICLRCYLHKLSVVDDPYCHPYDCPRHSALQLLKAELLQQFQMVRVRAEKLRVDPREKDDAEAMEAAAGKQAKQASCKAIANTFSKQFHFDFSRPKLLLDLSW